jgi:two-component system response regulator (stage 0 sporulation protein A)
MNSIRVLIVDKSSTARDAVEKALSDKEDVEVVGSVGNGLAALELIQSKVMNVLITDLEVPSLDGFLLIEAIRDMGLKDTTGVIVLTELMREDFIHRAMSLDVDYYMLKPFDPRVVGCRVMDFLPMARENTVARDFQCQEEPSLDERITEVLLSAGIPAHIKGYYFLREAVKIMVKEPDIINAITKELYPAVACHFDTSPLRVERAICHAISVAWSKGRMQNLRYAGDDQLYQIQSKPTNGKFIALIADEFLIEYTA